MRHIVTFDLDSTLCDTEHRFHMIDRTKPMDWKAYAKACGADELVAGVAALVRVCEVGGYECHYVTGRHNDSRQETIAWLREHLDEVVGVDLRLHMDTTTREDGDHVQEFGSHAAYKVHMVQSLAARLDAKVLFHVDDHASVAAALADAGIPCVCVRAPFEVRSLAARGDVTATNEVLL